MIMNILDQTLLDQMSHVGENSHITRMATLLIQDLTTMSSTSVRAVVLILETCGKEVGLHDMTIVVHARTITDDLKLVYVTGYILGVGRTHPCRSSCSVGYFQEARYLRDVVVVG